MHTVKTGTTIHEFQFITSISHLQQIEKSDYVVLVQNEDGVDVWSTHHRVRGVNDLVNYYKLWNGREINEEDIRVLVGINLRTIY